MQHRGHQKLTVAVFIGLIVLVPLAMWALPTRDVSELEARTLAPRPVLSRTALLSGEYFKQWDSYLSDQFPLRDRWVEASAFMQLRVFGKTRLNGEVVGGHGYLLRPPPLPPEDRRAMERGVDEAVAQAVELNEHAEAAGAHYLFVAAPSKPEFEREHYPADLEWPPVLDEAHERLFRSLESSGVDALDLGQVLEANRDETLYYKTDHHWTFKGAHLGYTSIMERLGLAPLGAEELEIVQLPNPFIGSEARAVSLVHPHDDRLAIGRYRKPVSFDLTIAGRREESKVYRLPDDARQPVTYGDVQMGGIHSEVVIETHRPELPDLVLVGDSFSSAVAPLLYTSFDTTRILDRRYYKELSVADYVKKHRPDYVVTLLTGDSYLYRKGNGDFGRPAASAQRSR